MKTYHPVLNVILPAVAAFALLGVQTNRAVAQSPVVNTGSIDVSSGTTEVISGPLVNDGAINVGLGCGFYCPPSVPGILEAPGITNSGGITVFAGDQLLVTGGAAYYQPPGGYTDLAGTLFSPEVDIAGGVLYGASAIPGQVSIEGNVTMSGGLLNPGNAPGALSVDGDFTLRDTTFLVDLTTALDVSGTATLNEDSLTFNPIAGLTPYAGELFPLVNASSISGGFTAGAIPFLVFDGGPGAPDGVLLVENDEGCTVGYSSCISLEWEPSTPTAAGEGGSTLEFLFMDMIAFAIAAYPLRLNRWRSTRRRAVQV